MTLDSTTSKVQYTQSGSTTEWPVPFKFLDNDHLIVITTVDGVDTTLVLDTDYTVAGAGDDEGGTVTISPAVASGTKVTIYRWLELLQPTQLTTAGGWYPPVHENVFDRLTMMIQQGQEQIDRSLKIPVTSDDAEAEDLIQSIYDAAAAAEASAASALAAIAAAQEAASQIGVLSALGILGAGESTINLPWEYDTEAGNVSVFLDGVKQAKDTLTFVDSTTITIGAAVDADTTYEVLSLVMNSESTLTTIYDDTVDARDAALAAAALAEDAADDAQDLLDGIIDVPLGTVIYMSGTSAPAGYVKANGQALLRASYPDFWAWVQTSGNIEASDAAWLSNQTTNGGVNGKYSPGDGSTTFRVPALGGSFTRSWQSDQTLDVGRTMGSYQADELKSHRHALNIFRNNTNSGGFAEDANNNGTQYTNNTEYAGGDETRPKNIALMACIKAYTSVSNPSIFQVANLEGAVQNLGTISGTVVIDTDLGDAIFTVGGALDLSFTGTYENGYGRTIALYVTNGGSFGVTWDSAVLWSGGTSPTLTVTGEDLIVMYTSNGGTTWLGVSALDFA